MAGTAPSALATAVALMLLAMTGAYMVFDLSVTSFLARVAPFDPMAAMGHNHRGREDRRAHAVIGPGDAFARAQSIFPSGKFMNFELPQEHPAYYSVRFTLPDEWRTWSGRATVRLDASTGAVLAVYDPLNAPLLNRLDDVAYPVHLGEAGGVPGRVLVMLAGLSLPVFYVTGVTLWWRKRRSRRGSRKANREVKI